MNSKLLDYQNIRLKLYVKCSLHTISENDLLISDAFINAKRIENFVTSNESIGEGNALTKEEYQWLFDETYINATAIYQEIYGVHKIYSNLKGSKSCQDMFRSYFDTNDIDERNAVLDKMAVSICDISDTQLIELVEILHHYLGKCN